MQFADWLRRNFFLFMALLIAAIVAYGFGRVLDANLIHPHYPKPPIVYVHASVFAGWVLLFVTQASLVRIGRTAWHMRLGLFGIALGCAIPVFGAWVAIAMAAINERHGDADAARFLVLPIAYMIAFAILFGFAVVLRVRPDYHRRLMLVATCTLTVAAFARFPGLPIGSWDVFVDALVLLGVARDLIVDKHVHAVYRWALPLLIAWQIAANYAYFSASPWWIAIARGLMRS
ncbi:MAG TPA: hypothetical protein VK760_03755 [Candidatus Acidoferrales bacterium]|nr:hypothetical protein [Candidatus Acidoferrales bacterium]